VQIGRLPRIFVTISGTFVYDGDDRWGPSLHFS
jgi:hypothetical protein